MKRETRFAHHEGVTAIEVTPDGKSIITCGDDGDIRIWSAFDDDDPVSFSASDSCYGIAFTSGQIVVGTGSNKVETYEYPKGKFLQDKLRFTAAVNHLDVSKDGKHLVAGSADMTFQVTSLDNSAEPPVKVNAHTGPLLSISIDPEKEFIATSGCDGHVCVWSFSKPQNLVKKWSQVFPVSNDITTSTTLCRMAWHPSLGKHLAVPFKEKVLIYSKGDWAEIQSLSCTKLTKVFSVVCYSSDASLIAAGGSDGTIAIWDSLTYQLKAQTRDADHIMGLEFHPCGSLLLGVDARGKLLSVQDFHSSEPEENKGPGSPTEESAEPKSDVFNDGMDDLFDDDGDNAISVSKIKADLGFIQDENGDAYVGCKKTEGSTVTDNDDAVSVVSEMSSKTARPPPSYFNPFTIPQKPFQPASTPEHLEHRFMVWNNVGIIRSYSSQDEEFDDDGIDIEFHDASFHPAIHMRNQFDFNIANMSTDVVVLGAPKSADSNSKIFCQHFSSWDRNKEWAVDLPRGEQVSGIALGTGWIAVATSENRIRILSVGGVQKNIYDFSGTIVAVAGFEEFLFVTYHNGVGVNGNQNIFFSLLKLSFYSSKLVPLIHEASLPLTKGSTLVWMGFTDEGTPAFADSKNMVRVLNGRIWSPYCDMREHLLGPNDNFWVVGLSEASSVIRAVKCKGSKFPPTVPRPTLMMLETKIPLCEMETEKSQLEDTVLRSFNLSATTKRMEKKGYDVEEFQEQAEAKTKEALFKLFTLFCKSDIPRDFRAHEYVCMMPSAKAVQVAIKASHRLHRGALTERLQAVGRRKLQQEEEGVLEENNDFESAQVVTHVEHRIMSSGDGRQYESEIDSSAKTSSFSSQISEIRDNPLINKQKEEIRSAIKYGSYQKSNPFRKTQSESMNGSLNGESQRLDDLSQEGIENVSKGMSKIDVWKKPVEKQNSLPEFNPKDPNRKSTGKRKQVDKKVKESVKEGLKKQRSVFEMMKSKLNSEECPVSPMSNDESNCSFDESTDGTNGEACALGGKRKRGDEGENSEKKSRLVACEDDSIK